MSADEPDVYYVPGARNHYKYEHDVVVLDERLKEYPEAHEYIKQHEFEHATKRGRTMTGLLSLEWEADFQRLFGDDEAVREVRRYYDECSPKHPMGLGLRLKFSVLDVARGLWNLALDPVSFAYRRTERVFRENELAPTNDQ